MKMISPKSVSALTNVTKHTLPPAYLTKREPNAIQAANALQRLLSHYREKSNKQATGFSKDQMS